MDETPGLYTTRVVQQQQQQQGGGGAKCGRWNPTAEQVKVLTDLFRAGLRTPSTDQIQMISTHLGSFGKIESKNVFYWFQNHKARERHHKKRRRSDPPPTDPSPPRRAIAASDHKSIREAPSRYHPSIIIGDETWDGREREIQTLELFPLTSYCIEEEVRRNESMDVSAYWDSGLPLDLRLSFV